ncbi:hypothetical protein BJ969_000060 [Saccharopolyspora gloriosae]|uniref:Uncharacterized protein n=1 Tax=Saccharopolyspora gloriosae TaxID=455344 RepID=A0A840NCK8_9PSEU|nr:hypothetical protein [Saccharopolyspora gloriosae]MBB5066972.1 hypothetical protein [Saccharopolyspora gloriosae]
MAVLVGTFAGGAGAAGTLLACRLLRKRSAPPEPVVPPRPAVEIRGDHGLGEPGRVDTLLRDLHRCEQAVARARCAVESVSSARAREALLMVVRRMDAELPSVEALVEVGRGLGAGAPRGLPDAERGDVVLRRVHVQIADVAERFGMITDHVLDIVVDLVAAPDLHRMHHEVAVLRDQFPLLRPMSAVFGPGERATGGAAHDLSAPAMSAF